MGNSIIQTSFGNFKVQIDNDVSFDIMERTQNIIGKKISIGGKNNCIFITIPNNKNTGFLHQLNTKHGGCEINNIPIRREKTVGMLNIVFTIIKERFPYIKYIQLDDMSDFECNLESGKVTSISLALYEIMFHQKTYYERHFNAYLVDKTLRQKYNDSKNNFLKAKPESFHFNNESLTMLLADDYVQTNNWKSFFEKLYEYNNKCILIAPWYKHTLLTIMDNISYERQSWEIDLSNTLIQNIPYTIIQQNAGGKNTRKLIQKQKNKMEEALYEDLYVYKYTQNMLHE
jgi:hypothetical protein